MTLDEMIKHHIDMAKLQENRAERWKKQEDDEAAKLNNMLAADHRQLAEWLTELKEAKRLLKAAVEDSSAEAESICAFCKNNDLVNGCRYADVCEEDNHYVWRYADEALALIGEEGGNNA